ncbi:MAG: tRNA lysidine(34) synthetase TilS [candidate division KSB1 bacterium]|nr:tRNA lysidine(34) synthetase TilS [candidate division KSB1 bacterium]
MTDLVKNFIDYNENHQLIRSGDHVLVAVSGGIDSVVLLHLLIQIRDQFGLQLEILHVNHGLRGEQSDRDERFVAQLAERYQLPLIVRKVNVRKYQERHKVSEEEGARLLRYQVFQWALKRTGADHIALGHQADDQVETILDHWLRGSGVKGLSGMPVRRGKIIRPLLFATRKEIETYARAYKLDFVKDETNVMFHYRRNRIRHELIPYLEKQFNPAVKSAILRTAGIMSEVEIYLAEQGRLAVDRCLVSSKKDKIILDLNGFLKYFIIVQKYALYEIVARLALPRSVLTANKIERILRLASNRRSGKKVKLSSEWEVWHDSHFLAFCRRGGVPGKKSVPLNSVVPLSNEHLLLENRLMTIREVPQIFPTDRTVEYIDYDQVIGELKIRLPQPGDRFRPLNSPGQKKLSDFFIDRKVPLHERREIPLLVCDAGIIWVVGHQIDDKFKITDRTTRVLMLKVIEKGIAA